MLKAVINLSLDNAIGRKNKLLFSIQKDLERFYELTKHHIVVMGSATADSLPFFPLPYRVNFVLTRQNTTKYNGLNSCVVNPQMVLQMAETADIWVIGGSYIYKLFEPYIELWEVTKVHEYAERHHDNIYYNLPLDWLSMSSSTYELGDRHTFDTYINYNAQKQRETGNWQRFISDFKNSYYSKND